MAPKKDEELSKLRAELSNQAALIKNLSTRVSYLEGKVCHLEGHLSISTHVTNLLSTQLDDLQQYSRRSCLVIDGIKSKIGETAEQTEKVALDFLVEELGIEEVKLESELDKGHRIGKVKKNGTQNIILKFKSDGFRADIYRKRK